MFVSHSDALTVAGVAPTAILPSTGPLENLNATIRVECLGGFSVFVEGHQLKAPAARAARLFKFLLCAKDHCATKDEIAELLWPGELNGPKNLQAAAHDVRSWLGQTTALSYGSFGYSLRVCQSDAEDFEHLAKSARAAWPTNRKAARYMYEAAIRIYAGPLLPEEPYLEWIALRRHRLQDRFIEAALKVAACLLSDHEPEGALDLATRVTELDEAMEDAVRIEMQALAQLGRRAQALRRFERLRAFLARELHCRPDPSTEALRARLLAL